MLHQIGSGVLGPVFRTYQPEQDRLVAVKAFRFDIVPEQAARLAEALRGLERAAVSHPTIVPVLGAGLEGMSPYLAMEYISAETLDVALRNLAPAPLDRALPLLADIAAAIEAGWGAGVGHGALHPRDVFVASESDVCVTGFGVAAALEAVGIKVPPRRPYVAPERVGGQPWDIRADIYSLGVIAHELLTKRRPAGASDQDGSFAAGTSAEQRALVRQVLAAAMADRPEHRFPSPAAFVAALQAVASGDPVGTLPAGSDLPASAGDDAAAVRTAPLLALADKPETPKSGTAAVTPSPVTSSRPGLPGSTEPRASAPISTPAVPIDVPPVPSAVPPLTAGAALTRKGTADSLAAPAADAPLSHPPAPSIAALPNAPSPPFITPAPSVTSPAAQTATRSRAAFPWAAVAAAAVGGLALGIAGGYRLGLAHERALTPPPVASVTTDSPASIPGTDVAVAPTSAPTATASATPPGTSDAATPPPAESAKARPAETLTDRAPISATRTRVETGPGSVTIETRPAGARIFLDGRLVGMTPMTVQSLRAGNHPVRLELTGHKTLTTAVAIAAGDHTRLAVTLEDTQVFEMPGTPRQVKKKE